MIDAVSGNKNTMPAQRGSDGESQQIADEIKTLQQQMKAVQKDQKISSEEKQKKIKELQKRITRLQERLAQASNKKDAQAPSGQITKEKEARDKAPSETALLNERA